MVIEGFLESRLCAGRLAMKAVISDDCVSDLDVLEFLVPVFSLRYFTPIQLS